MDIKPVDQPRGRPIAESLEGRPNQDSSAVSLVEETARIFDSSPSSMTRRRSASTWLAMVFS